MPVNFLATVFKEGTSAIPHYDKLKVWVPSAAVVGALKYYFAGPRNTWQRDMHGRVVLMTGGTSGVGAAVAKELALGGAQLILLVRSLDEWTTDYVDDLREATGNTTVYAEQMDLNDFMSVRKFATKWIDNSPPRRLDMVVCCAATATPPFVDRQASLDGLEKMFQINYLSHLHLLNILAPALRSQPPDREVRVVLTSCIASVMGTLELDDLAMDSAVYNKRTPWRVLGASKLALSLVAYELQRQFNAYERKDKAPNNVHMVIADPGMMRSPSFKRFFSCGSLLGLLLYLILWPIWWVFLRTSIDGSQSILHAITNPDIAEQKECIYVSDSSSRGTPPRAEFKDEKFQKKLWEKSNELIAAAEKQTVLERKKQEPKSKPKGTKGAVPTTAASDPKKASSAPKAATAAARASATTTENVSTAPKKTSVKTTKEPNASPATKNKLAPVATSDNATATASSTSAKATKKAKKRV